MSDTSIRRTGEFILNLFNLLRKSPSGLKSSEAVQQLATTLKLTDYEKGFYESGGQRFEKILRFATVDCVKAGWMLKEKGNWSLTEAGLVAHSTYQDPEKLYREARKLYAEWRRANKADETIATTEINPIKLDEEIDVAEKSVRISYDVAEEHAWDEVSNYLRNLPPYDFQDLVAELIKAMGYHVSWVAPPGKDGGIDIWAAPDVLGTQSPRIKIQVKRQQQAVTVDGLRSFLAVLGDGDVGLFVATGGFTKDAEYEARTQEKRRISLINLERFFDLWVEYYPKLSDQARRRLALKPIYFLSPEI